MVCDEVRSVVAQYVVRLGPLGHSTHLLEYPPMALDRSMDRRLRGIMTGVLQYAVQPRVMCKVMCVCGACSLGNPRIDICVKKNCVVEVITQGTVVTGVVTFGLAAREAAEGGHDDQCERVRRGCLYGV